MKLLRHVAIGLLMAWTSVAFGQAASQFGKFEVKNGREIFANEYNSKVILNFQNDPSGAYNGAGTMARCLAKNARDKAGQLLGGPLTDDPGFDRLTRALTGKYKVCYPEGAAGLPLFVINAALAEELLRSGAPSLQDRVVPTDLNGAKSFYSGPSGLTMDSLGRCLAVYSPGLAYRVLKAPAGSAQEQQAMGMVYAYTPECGVTAMPKDIPAVEQRSALATGLYAWVHRG